MVEIDDADNAGSAASGSVNVDIDSGSMERSRWSEVDVDQTRSGFPRSIYKKKN